MAIEQILAWADMFHNLTGRWPTRDSGPIAQSLGETWQNIDAALKLGLRGLPGGSSLARLFADLRGVRNRSNLPKLTVNQILAWADAHFQRTKKWPEAKAGPILDAPRETWRAVNGALNKGLRGLPGGSSLAKLLTEHRGVRARKRPPKLIIDQILAWSDSYHERTGRWPTVLSGLIEDAPGETWSGVDQALARGQRGLPGGLSLAKLLAEYRGLRNCNYPPRLSIEQILAWANAHHARMGKWPTVKYGPIIDAPDETWAIIDGALREGLRGLSGGSSLARLIDESLGVTAP